MPFFYPFAESLPSWHTTLTNINVFSAKLTEEANNANETNIKRPKYNFYLLRD